MGFFGFLIVIAGWIWSVGRGLQVSMLCLVLNFMFPPLAQIIFAVYEPPIRAPLWIMAIGTALMYFGGALKIADSGFGFSLHL